MNLQVLCTEDDVRANLHEIVRADGEQKITAKRLGISPQYLGDVLHGRRAISAGLAASLGYTRVTLFTKQAASTKAEADPPA